MDKKVSECGCSYTPVGDGWGYKLYCAKHSSPWAQILFPPEKGTERIDCYQV